MPSTSPDDLWKVTLGELEVQLTRANFNTWLRGTRGLAFREGAFIVGVPTPFATAWLERNLSPLIRKTFAKIAGADTPVVFEVLPAAQTCAPPPAPLLAPAALERPSRRSTTGFSGTPLNPRYTFETFIVGEANRFTHAAALAVAEKPGQAYNPLFVYGGVGLGKTHLLHAIAHHCIRDGLAVRYITSEQFTNQFIHALRERKTEEFRARFRSVDVLLIDDIHFISQKEQTQETFFHTFNDLHNAGAQIVLSSDRSPHSMPLLEDRLRSRFEWGLIADVQPPNLEVRIAILASKAQELGFTVPQDTLEFIAHRFQHNVRELEGALNRVLAKAQLTQQPPTLQLAHEALDDLLSHWASQPISPERLLHVVAAHFNLKPDDLAGPRRSQDVALARHVCMHLLRTEAKLTLAEIGQRLGGRDHSTVLHGCDKIAAAQEANPSLRRLILELAATARAAAS